MFRGRLDLARIQRGRIRLALSRLFVGTSAVAKRRNERQKQRCANILAERGSRPAVVGCHHFRPAARRVRRGHLTPFLCSICRISNGCSIRSTSLSSSARTIRCHCPDRSFR